MICVTGRVKENQDHGQAGGRRGLAHLSDASHFYNWAFSLPLGKSNGLFMNRVGAGEPLTVLVEHRHLPLMVFSPFVFSVRSGFPMDFHLEQYSTLNSLSA